MFLTQKVLEPKLNFGCIGVFPGNSISQSPSSLNGFNQHGNSVLTRGIVQKVVFNIFFFALAQSFIFRLQCLFFFPDNY
jgi:hypothetical protein